MVYELRTTFISTLVEIVIVLKVGIKDLLQSTIQESDMATLEYERVNIKLVIMEYGIKQLLIQQT